MANSLALRREVTLPGGSPQEAHMRTRRLKFVHLISASSSGVRECLFTCFPLIDLDDQDCRRRLATSHYLSSLLLPPRIPTGNKYRGCQLLTTPNREKHRCTECNDAEITTPFLWCGAQPDPLRLNVRPSAKRGRTMGGHLRKLARDDQCSNDVRKPG